MPALLMSLLSNILPSVLNKVAGDKMSEEDKAKFQIEALKMAQDQDWKSIQAEYDDRNNARSLAEKDIAKGNAVTGILAATVRPAWGYGALVLVAYSVIGGFVISSPLQDIIQTVLFFFFGGRTLEKIIPTVSDAYTQGKQVKPWVNPDAGKEM